MEEKRSNPFSTEFLRQFFLEARHHSGLPLIDAISLHYFNRLYIEIFYGDKSLTSMNDHISEYMMLVHEIYMRNKTWKSYDW